MVKQKLLLFPVIQVVQYEIGTGLPKLARTTGSIIA